ncbi:type I-B CRISPR-associated protein Cas5b [Clostridium ihumii]|uniref:type I-B CRISPR-associated protein Cas5b n=1 Tax=Clostridium ihumii TaxID=1470356 RepID=UPI000555EB47|nr:type I-B CRISPR-associated protein Cas5b [Clostridium ihumii]
MKTIVFTAKGDFARFRVAYTTTSALTYSVIHPIAVKGMIGAIMGIDYSELYEYTKNMNIGIQVLEKINKDTQSFNLIAQSDCNDAANFQSRVEFLRNVKYRIFLEDEDDKIEQIERIIKNRNFQFTPYLGCSEHIAKIDFERVVRKESIEHAGTCDTVMPKEFVGDITYNRLIYFDRIPIKNSNTREYTKYEKVIFSVKEKLNIKKIKLYKVGDFNVYFF